MAMKRKVKSPELKRATAERHENIFELHSKQRTEKARQRDTQKAARLQLRAAQSTERKELSELQTTARKQLREIEREERKSRARGRRSRKAPKVTKSAMMRRLQAAQSKASKALRARHVAQTRKLAEVQAKRRTGLADKHREQLAKLRAKWDKLLGDLRTVSRRPRVSRSVSHRPRPSRPPTVAALKRRILQEFGKLDAGGRNQVTLAAMRSALHGVARDSVDNAINELRRERKMTLESSDGRHVRPSPDELAAAIKEDGQLLVYMARIGAGARSTRSSKAPRPSRPSKPSKLPRPKPGRRLTMAELAEYRERAKAPFDQAEFERAFIVKFRRATHRGPNLLPIGHMRAMLSDRYSRAEFDRGLRALREQQKFSLAPHEGRSGKLDPEDQKGAILEGGRLLVYVQQRRDR